MQKYGIIQNEELVISSAHLDGYKPIVFAEIPEFDQSTQYVVQSAPVDSGDFIFADVEIHELEITEGEMLDETLL